MDILGAIGILFGLLGAGDPPPGIEKANSVERILRFEYRIINLHPESQDVEICLALPRTNERQEVFSVVPEEGYQEILEDRWGNRLARYLEKDLQPGEVRSRGWMASARMEAAVFGRSAGAAPLSPAERELYTQDGSRYQIAAPEIIGARDSVVKEGMTDAEKSFALFRHLIHRVTYFRDDRWDPAPVVLQTGLGSCSEFNYVLIALLRSCGIPCRYTGGVILTADNDVRYDPRIHEDAVHHRWTEIHLGDLGWFPADGSRGAGALKRFDNFLNCWGRIPAGSLQTFRGDGSDDGPLGWDYVANARGKVLKSLKRMTLCFWIEAPRESLAGALKDVREALDRGLSPESLRRLAADSLLREALFFHAGRIDRKLYPALAEALREAGHPGAVYYSILSERLGLEVPPALKLEALCDENLRSKILERLGEGKKDWAAFEAWWRKARPEVSLDKEKRTFAISRTDIEIH